MKIIFKKNFNAFTKIILISSLFAASSAHAIKFHGPLIVDDTYIKKHGNIITGNYQGTNDFAAVTIVTPANVTIINSTLSGPSDLIQALTYPANITVTNTTGTATNPNVRGVQKGIFLHVKTFTNINMSNNTIQGVRIGFYCSGYAGNHTINNTLTIDKNVFTNIDARPSDGNGNYFMSGQYNGQAIHTGAIYNVPGIDIGWNEVMNTPNQSSTGALFEFNETSGTPSSLMQIHDNYIQGAFPSDPGKDLYDYGGILINGGTADSAGTASSYMNLVTNRVVATANYGIALAAGHDITMNGNRVVSSGFTSTGVFYPMSTYGDAYGAVNQNIYNQSSTVFFNNIIENSVLGLIKNNGSGSPVRSDWSLPGQGGAIDGNTDYVPNDSSDPTVADEQQEFIDWQNSNIEKNILVGAH